MDPLILLFIGMTVVLGGILAFKMHAFLALVLGALIVATLTPHEALVKYWIEAKKLSPEAAEKAANQQIGEKVAIEFGSTAGKIGLLIALASILGKCMLDSGSADKIVRSTLRMMGEKRAPAAFASSGFLLGIPIFFDTVFLLMVPLAKALWTRTRRDYPLYIMCIICGATMTHSLVPPTPGPLFVAKALGVSIGAMILGGCIVGVFTSAAGYCYAIWANRRLNIPVRETAQASIAELEVLSQRDEKELPPLWLALLPIVLPIALIGGATVVDAMVANVAAADRAAWQNQLVSVFDLIGNANIAMAISTAIALMTLYRQGKQSLQDLSKGVQDALLDGGLIILITSAGGAFGGILQQTGIATRIKELSASYQIGILPLAWAITVIVRVAQGSATVAMITAVGVVAGMTENLAFHPVYVALAIGCGSKPVPWMNDSGFWVITRMSGMTEKEGLKTFTPMVTIMGIVGLIVTMLLSKLFPMVS